MFETPWDSTMALKARKKTSASPSLAEFDLTGLIPSPLKKKGRKPKPSPELDLLLLIPQNKKKADDPFSLLGIDTNAKPEDTPQGYYVQAENLAPGMKHGLDYAPNYPPAEILSVSENLGGRVKVRYLSPNRGDGREGLAEAIIAADKWCFIVRGKTRVDAGPPRPVGRPRKTQAQQDGLSLLGI